MTDFFLFSINGFLTGSRVFQQRAGSFYGNLFQNPAEVFGNISACGTQNRFFYNKRTFQHNHLLICLLSYLQHCNERHEVDSLQPVFIQVWGEREPWEVCASFLFTLHDSKGHVWHFLCSLNNHYSPDKGFFFLNLFYCWKCNQTWDWPSGGRFEVATTTTPFWNRFSKSCLRIMASAISVT